MARIKINARRRSIRYICDGSVRGWCGIQHRTEAAAEACIKRDHAGCSSQGGYSDRIVKTVAA